MIMHLIWVVFCLMFVALDITLGVSRWRQGEHGMAYVDFAFAVLMAALAVFHGYMAAA